MPWQIQVRRKHDGREWEPISVERCRIVPGWIDGPAHERQYHYESLDEVKLAFAEYVDIEGGLPNLLVRLATGRPKFTDKYDVRFVWISQPGIVWTRETLPATAPLEAATASPAPPNTGSSERNKCRHEFTGIGLGPTPGSRCVLCGVSMAEIWPPVANYLDECVRSNFKRTFPGKAENLHNMPLLMADEILQLRRDRNTSAQQVAELKREIKALLRSPE